MRAANTKKGVALIASGTYNAGEGLVMEAEEDFAEAFEMFAPVRRTRREQAHPVRNREVVWKPGYMWRETCLAWKESVARQQFSIIIVGQSTPWLGIENDVRVTAETV